MAGGSRPFRVIVIGGGPAGLLTAQALKKIGIAVTVFEGDASPAARPRDWNFGIYWAQTPLADLLPSSLAAEVHNAQVDNSPPSADTSLPMHNLGSGEVVKTIPVPYVVRLHRRNFLRVLSQDVDIRYGKRLVRIESNDDSATAFFEDGTSETANLLVGAEGAHSLTRETLLGPSKAALHPSPLVASMVMAKLPADQARTFAETINPRMGIAVHPDGTLSWISVHDAFQGQPGDWTYMMMQSWKADQVIDMTPKDILQDMKRRANSFAEPFRSIWQSIPKDTMCWHNRLRYWPPEPWDNRQGTVTLAGDAAHPMTFHRGQGLNNAVHDVATLMKGFQSIDTSSRDEVRAALREYEREIQQRGRKAVYASLENSLALHEWDTMMQSQLVTSGTQKD